MIREKRKASYFIWFFYCSFFCGYSYNISLSCEGLFKNFLKE